jgi:6-phosphogluconolactonase
LKLDVAPDPHAAAARAAASIASAARASVQERGRFVLALSGGRDAPALLAALAAQNLPWALTHVLQVDERVVPRHHQDRNLTLLERLLASPATLSPDRLLGMPVEAPDLARAAADYASTVANLAGSPSVLDVVHLGLGEDGHTAGLMPGDPALGAPGDVALGRDPTGRLRMTLTLPLLARARSIVWLVTGSTKVDVLARLIRGDPSIPAGRVARENAVVFADQAAAPGPSPARRES